MEPPMHGAMKSPRSARPMEPDPKGGSPIETELRGHVAAETPPAHRQDIEICIVLGANDDGQVRGTGQCLQAMPTTGAIRLGPIGHGDKVSTIADPIPSGLHLHVHLPRTMFDRLSEEFELPNAPVHAAHFVAGVEDEVIHRVASSTAEALTHETTVGRMYVETASLMLAARLLQRYLDSEPPVAVENVPQKFDRVRLQRVLDYIASNIEDDISLDSLASVAGYSPCHFARKFTLAMGIPPSRYVSGMRLEKAKAELAACQLPLAEIALNARFSSQASFTRAFHRATGLTPKQYQRGRQ